MLLPKKVKFTEEKSLSDDEKHVLFEEDERDFEGDETLNKRKLDLRIVKD